MTDSARALTLGQHARPPLAEVGSAGGIPSLSIGLAGDPGRGSVCCP
jgi:hypothetical protein